MRNILVISMLLTLLCFTAQAAPAPTLDDELPVKVSSDDMTYDMNKNTVTFTGNVQVVRGDFVLTARTIVLFLKTNSEAAKKPDAPSALTGNSAAGKASETPAPAAAAKPSPVSGMENNDIDRIEAEDNVHFTYGTQSGDSQNATYEAGKGLLILRGDPVVRDGENSIRGDIIRYYLNERRSEVQGKGNKRVEAIFSGKK